MGLVKTPNLYRCGVSINGVLNLKKFNDDGRHLLFKTINKTTWNQGKDIKSFSPLHLAKNIQSPLLMIASKKDTIVPYQHSKKMHKTLKRLKKESSYIELKEGEHWRTNQAKETAIFTALEEFLAEHLR